MGCSYQKQTPEDLLSKQGKVSTFHLSSVAKNTHDGKILSRISGGGQFHASLEIRKTHEGHVQTSDKCLITLSGSPNLARF